MPIWEIVAMFNALILQEFLVAEEGRCPPTVANLLIFDQKNHDCLTV